MNYDDHLKQKLADPEFRRAWEADEPAFQIIRAIVGARSRLGWTQSELARRMGTTQASISRAENTGAVTPEFLVRFAQAVGGSATLTLKVPGSRQLPLDATWLTRRSPGAGSRPENRAALQQVVRRRGEPRPAAGKVSKTE